VAPFTPKSSFVSVKPYAAPARQMRGSSSPVQ